ncbi:hypothetical protein ES708_28878 [subsurface metagenome]
MKIITTMAGGFTFFHYLWKLFVLLFLMTLFNGTLFSCKQISEKRTDQIVKPKAEQSYSLKNDPMVLQPGPAQGDTLMTNPPGFHWPQENGDKGYAYPDQWHLTVSIKDRSKAVSFIVEMKVRSAIGITGYLK